MSLIDGIRQAAQNIRTHRLRASLATLAMAAAVATMAITITGLNSLSAAARQTSARAFGSNTFVVARVFGSGLSRKALAEELRRNPSITRVDLRFLERHAAEGVLYSAIAQRAAEVTAGGRTFEGALVNGVSASLADIRDVGIDRGRFFSRDEELRAAQVAVLGWSLADTLFPGRDPVGGAVRIGGRGFTVIGVQVRQGTAGGVSLDRYAWIPYPMFERIFGAPESLQVFARASDPARTDAAEDRARAGMRARRQLQPGAPDNFSLLTPEAAREFVASVTEKVGAAGVPISLMALLAAIVVVANTMLVSVTQRTREIGIRRAVGATGRQVLVEVLAESALVSVAGAVVGLVVAALVLEAASGAFGSPLVLAPATAAMSVGAAGLSGALAGWFPARSAATADIVLALHAE